MERIKREKECEFRMRIKIRGTETKWGSKTCTRRNHNEVFTEGDTYTHKGRQLKHGADLFLQRATQSHVN